MKKILIIADPIDDQKAGIHVYTKKIIENLLKYDKKNHYIFIHKSPNIFFKDTENYIIKRRKIPGYGTLRKFFLIPKLIRKLQPDIVWEPCHIGPFNIPKTIKRVVTIHDLTPIKFPQFHIKNSTIIHKLLFRRVIKNADLILTNSQTTKKDIIEYQSTKTEISVIPLGIDPPTEKTHPSKNPYILYLGTIEPRKDMQTLITAYQKLKTKHKLIIAGEIGWKSNIKHWKKNPNIIFTGYINEQKKAKLLSEASLFVYPSIYEGFGLPVLEAMSYGLPVICSDGGSLGEIFRESAEIFPAQNPKALKKSLQKVLSNPKLQKHLKHQGLKFSKNFSWQKTALSSLGAIENI